MLILAPFLVLCGINAQTSQPWVEQTLDDGVRVTAPLKLIKLDIPNPGRSSKAQIIAWAARGHLCSYTLALDVPNDPEKFKTPTALSEFVLGLGESAGKEIIGERDIVVQGWPGIAISFRTPSGITAVTHAVRCNSMIVSIGCAFRSADTQLVEADRYLESLHLPSTGTLTKAAIELTRYPLGDSGITALFPSQPKRHEAPVGLRSRGTTMVTYTSAYAFKLYSVGYLDVPKEVVSKMTGTEKTSAFAEMRDEILDGLHGSKTAQMDFAVGKDVGQKVDFTTTNDMKGTILICFHGPRMVILTVFGPKVYVTPATVDTFVQSIEFKS